TAAVRQSPTSLRDWQERALVAMDAWSGGPFLISAAPGAGKTRPALEFARRQLKAGTIRRVVVVCPTTPLTRQWAAAAAPMGLHLVPDAADLRPPADFAGVAVTYARVAASAARWATQCTPGTLVIADEAHHLGEELAWGEGFHLAFGRAQRRLLLSGTPFRSDQCPIPDVRYDDGVAMPDVSYSYADAVRDRICRPVTFIPYDGVLQWRNGEELVEASFEDALVGREAGRRYRTAISIDLADGLPRILGQAHARLEEARAAGHKDAGGLVVTADTEHARAVAQVLREVTGVTPTVVLHTDSQAARRLQEFARSTDRWIVAVNMVSEGVDIPRLRVGVYATAARTPLIFRQIVGRFVRTIQGRPLDMSWLYLPADPVLRAHARDIERELRHILRPPSEGDPAELDELPDRAETEKREPDHFVPVAADVAPQLALFGGGPAPPAPPRIVPSFAPAVEAPDEAEMPAFERRALLRDKRHRLVSDLRRVEGSSHAEINRWLNRSTGIQRVDDASISQLERSVDLLLERLSGPRRR
ncbi:MAG: DEAD/DEAH box helicase family protein, partial [Solirubrobacteraceae bacterium]